MLGGGQFFGHERLACVGTGWKAGATFRRQSGIKERRRKCGGHLFGKVVDIEVRPLSPPPGVVDLAELFSAVRQRPYAMLLLSGGDLDCAGYSLMGWDPFLVLRARGRRVWVQQGRDPRVCKADPFVVLEDLLGAL